MQYYPRPRRCRPDGWYSKWPFSPPSQSQQSFWRSVFHSSAKAKVNNVKDLETCANIFVHAVLGCVIQSQEYMGLAKVLLLRRLWRMQNFRSKLRFLKWRCHKEWYYCSWRESPCLSIQRPVWRKSGFDTIFEILPEDHNRDFVCTSWMSPSDFCSRCLPQPQGLPPGTAMERYCAPATRLGLQTSGWKSPTRKNWPTSSSCVFVRDY